MKIFFLIIILILSFGCTKKVVETVAVLQIENDISIPSGKDIKFFSFPSVDIGYAASDSMCYKTSDGGKSWQKLNLPSNQLIKGVEFFDELNGMILLNRSVYCTFTGGLSWVSRGESDFISISENGIGVIGDADYLSCLIKRSLDKGKTFQKVGEILTNGDYFVVGKIVDSLSVIILEDVTKDGNSEAMNVYNGQTVQIKYPGLTYKATKIYDFFLKDNYGIFVGQYGWISEYGAYRSYNAVDGIHHYNYYSVDAFDYAVAVGERTIKTNKDVGSGRIWQEVFDESGNGFDNNFYKVKFYSPNQFYLSGNKGLLYKCKI